VTTIQVLDDVGKGDYTWAVIGSLTSGKASKVKVLGELIPNASNYRTIFQKTYGVLKKEIQIPHTLPQKYVDLFNEAKINIHEMKYLEGIPTKIHEKITTMWRNWDKDQNGGITVEKVMQYADEIEEEFGKYFIPKN
jgi:translation initiation factor RLI1